MRWLAVAAILTTWSTSHAETRPILPLPEGLYSDGGSCGAAEIRRNPRWDGFSVRDVIGDACQLKAVTQEGSVFHFRSACSEGNGSAYHEWTAEGRVTVTGPETFSFDGLDYRRCAADQGGGSADNTGHPDRHLPLVAGSYRAPGGTCGGLVYWDNPRAAGLGAMFGGPAFGGDVCTVKRVTRSGDHVTFESTCIPTRSGAAMRISVPTAIALRSAERFKFRGRPYDLCKRITY